ncbi:ABC transporter permease [Vulgatibacter sp.]|uniref:ABC transporter permease n=1 Tax=Vulgatibacter sp. TaxID=1971226 RepID=UPI00356A7AA2
MKLPPRLRALLQLALSMQIHDRAKFAGGVVGVVFATVLAGQQSGLILGLLAKSRMVIEHGGAAVWIVPPNTQQPQAGRIPEEVLYRARAVPGVSWTSPLLWTAGSLALPEGGTEQVTILGVEQPGLGGPWNVVAGDPRHLLQARTLFFEDAEREKLGHLDLGSLREVNGRQIQAVGFTWGAIPFGPSYAFASFDTAREIAGRTDRDPSMILVGVEPGSDPAEVAKALQARLDDVEVLTSQAFALRAMRFVLVQTPMGMMLGISALFGLLVGFAIVSITMYSAVLDNLREFGTLKAIGATTADLGRVLILQALIYAGVGSAVGITALGFIGRAVRSAKVTLRYPPELLLGLLLVMAAICIAASLLGLLRLRKLEPGIVFRG